VGSRKILELRSLLSFSFLPGLSPSPKVMEENSVDWPNDRPVKFKASKKNCPWTGGAVTGAIKVIN